MFLQKEDLKNNIYGYQVDQITEGDDSIVLQAMAAAEQELKSYLQGNNKREYLDGRLRYDIDKIFAAQGEERNAMLLNCAINIAKWNIIDLCNVDILYERAKERYDRAIDWLKALAKGEVNLPDLPVLSWDDSGSTDPNDPNSKNEKIVFVYGSRPKFQHNFNPDK
ncbi:phage protein Gp36 family protein [Ornithobacterium rhinotracheale]|uniref:phage protein Gp36 family protein n=1 Tax=Ornithobacterium rhinotracheale TaxID=28251 RepID=UPI00403A0442